VSTYQKVAAFQINGNQKQGGNVAGYFCTPDGRVLNAIAGPVDEAAFLREARWAADTYKLARTEARNDDGTIDAERLRTYFANAQAERLRVEHGLNLADENAQPRRKLGNQGKVQLLLAAAPLPRLKQVYKLVFEKVLNEKVSAAPVAVR
jgi:hypothetical protein